MRIGVPRESLQEDFITEECFDRRLKQKKKGLLNLKLVFKKLRETAKTPVLTKGNPPAFMLFANLDEDRILFPGDIKVIRTGITFSMQEKEFPDLSVLVMPSEEMVKEKGLYLANGLAVIAGEQKGEICVAVINSSKVMRSISDGDQIAKLVVTRIQVPGLSAENFKQEESKA